MAAKVKAKVKPKMKENEFYSLVLKKRITVPVKDIVYKIRNGRRFGVCKYQANGKTYEAWKVLGMK